MTDTAQTPESREAIRNQIRQGTRKHPPTGGWHILSIAAMLDLTEGELNALIRPMESEEFLHEDLVRRFGLDGERPLGAQLAERGWLPQAWGGWIDGAAFPFDTTPPSAPALRTDSEPHSARIESELFRRCRECGEVKLMTTAPHLGLCDDCA